MHISKVHGACAFNTSGTPQRQRVRTIEWARLMNRVRALVHLRVHKLVDRRPVQCRCRMGALAAFIIGALVVVLRVVGAGRATAVAGGGHACHMHAHYTAYLIDGVQFHL